MKKIAFLSCESLEGYIVDDHLLAAELGPGYEVTTLPWSRPYDWSTLDAVIVRTTWDYTKAPERFVEVLQDIQRSGTKLFNSMSVINWNIHKSYLKELSDKGIPTVPTVFFHVDADLVIPADWENERFIVKPAISASAFKTTILSRSSIEDGSFRQHLSPGDWLLQPFVETISEGEYSLIFFDKKFSHAVLKIPKPGDFRVQEEHGGNIIPVDPSPTLLATAGKVLREIDLPLLYARVDLIPHQGQHVLMELELIEPALYFRACPEAAKNFKAAFESFL